MTLEGVTNLAVSTVREASKRIYRPIERANISVRKREREKHFRIENFLLLKYRPP